jgi:hypothetical protein
MLRPGVSVIRPVGAAEVGGQGHELNLGMEDSDQAGPVTGRVCREAAPDELEVGVRLGAGSLVLAHAGDDSAAFPEIRGFP